MISVTALSCSQLDPVSRVRMRQHIPLLNQAGVRVIEQVPAISKYTPLPGWPSGISPMYGLPFHAAWGCVKLTTRLPGILSSWRSQITWLLRPLLEETPSLEPLLKKPLVLDVDDAVWLCRPFGAAAARIAAQRASVVVAGNRYLADWFSQYAKDVQVIPTAVDTDRFKPDPARRQRSSGTFVIGWIGTASNLPYLEAIESALKRFLETCPAAELQVVADQPPALRSLPSARVRFVPWSEQGESAAVARMDVGLMPLPDNVWTRGKCSFKMLQYMACGLPVVVSPVGANAELLALAPCGLSASTESEWIGALEHLYRDSTTAAAFGQAGRVTVERYFSRQVVAARLVEIFCQLA